jgi:hypothetical protein
MGALHSGEENAEGEILEIHGNLSCKGNAECQYAKGHLLTIQKYLLGNIWASRSNVFGKL